MLRARLRRTHICLFSFFSSRRRHTRCGRDWSSDVCSSDLIPRATQDSAATAPPLSRAESHQTPHRMSVLKTEAPPSPSHTVPLQTRTDRCAHLTLYPLDRKSTRLNSSHVRISYAVFCL